jgi:hypothetical protein
VMPAAMEAAAGAIEEAAIAKVDARLNTGDLLKQARVKLEESGLPESFVSDAYARLSEGEFTPVEADGDKPAKSAREVMEAAVAAEVTRCTALVEAAGGKVEAGKRHVTTVSGNGGGSGEDNGRAHVSEADTGHPDEWRSALQEAGIDPVAAYGVKTDKPAEDAE